MNKIATYMGKDISKYKKKQLIEIITTQQNAIIKISEKMTYPPVIMMEPQKVVEKYNILKKEHSQFKKLFWRFYWK